MISHLLSFILDPLLFFAVILSLYYRERYGMKRGMLSYHLGAVTVIYFSYYQYDTGLDTQETKSGVISNTNYTNGTNNNSSDLNNRRL